MLTSEVFPLRVRVRFRVYGLGIMHVSNEWPDWYDSNCCLLCCSVNNAPSSVVVTCVASIENSLHTCRDSTTWQEQMT